jgi:hypothetical protein
MRKSAIAVTCVFLLAALVFPGAAIAKGGNGRHSGDQHNSEQGNSHSDKGKDPDSAPGQSKGKGSKSDEKAGGSQAPAPGAKADESDTKAPASKSAKPSKSGAPQSAPAAKQPSTAKKPADKQARTAPKPKKAAEKPAASLAAIHDPVADDSLAPTPDHAADANEAPVSTEQIAAADAEPRGVLDTIHVVVDSSLDAVSSALADAFSAVTSWFGG